MHALRALAAIVVVSLFIAPAPASPGGDPIQPGDVIVVGNSQCTLAFRFDGVGDDAGRTFFATAKHCVGHIGQVATSSGNGAFGTVAAFGNGGSTHDDWALIEVYPSENTLAAVRGHPDAPTGVATPADTAAFDIVRMSGYGTGFSITSTTREDRIGLIRDHTSAVVSLYGPVLPGDSGGPWFTADGKALGIVSKIRAGFGGNLGASGAWNEGATIEEMLDDAAAKGFDLALSTV